MKHYLLSICQPDGDIPAPEVLDWLPDGRLLVTGDKLRRQEPDRSMVTLAEQGGNEIVVDGRGNIYINSADFNFAGGEAPSPLSPATSSSSRRTPSYARSLMTSSSPTAWS
jgi:hypothetical protein